MYEKENNKIKIKPIGSYAEIDSHGYIINPTGMDKIQDNWWPVIEIVKEFYIDTFGDDLHSVFIRGSAAKGKAVDYVSDLDSFCFVKNLDNYTNEDIDTKDIRNKVKESYPFANGIEIVCEDYSDIPNKSALLNQSLQIYGDKIDVPRLKPGKDMIINAKGLANAMIKTTETLNEFKKNGRENELLAKCEWIMKRLLRSGIEITYERSGRFTRDLYLCYKDFSEFYPEFESDMYRVLDLALNPTTDVEEIKNARDGVLPLLLQEIERLGISKKP